MGVFDKFKTQLKKAVTPKSSRGASYSFGQIDYTVPTIPCIIEKKNDPWVWYGEEYPNSYMIQVADLRNGSAIHNSIVKTKTKMTAGDGLLIDGAKNEVESKAKYDALPANVKADYDLIVNNSHDKDTLQVLTEKLADDFQTHGQYAREVIFNNDFTKIVRQKYINAENLLSGKIENGEVKSYWLCRDWSRCKQKGWEPTEIHVFDKTDKVHLNQIIFEKAGKNEYYGELPYKGALTWIMIDFKMGVYHLSGIDNGYNPGMHFRFFKPEPDENKRQAIINDLKKRYKGATKTNNPFITFSDGKENAMEIQPVQVTNLDKQLLLLAELADQKILTGHQLSVPMLAGVTPRSVFNSGLDTKVGAAMFDNLSMASDRNHLAASLQKVFDYNKTPVKIEINPFDLFKVRNVTSV